MTKSIFLALSILLLSPGLRAERWKVQFLYDEDNSSLTIQDLVFPNEKTGIACGALQREKSIKGIVMVTRDGGVTWQRIEVAELPLSLQFLNESTGFMVTSKGLWKTEERGLTWKKLKGWNNVLQVHFIDAGNGFAIGPNRTMLSTTDGGKTWIPVAEAKKLPASTNFHSIAFQDAKRGLAMGSSSVPQRRDSLLPEWIDPESAAKRRQWPSLSASLETRDGGKTWEPQTAPIFGTMARLRFVPQGVYGMSIIQFEHAFEVPSEVYLFNWKTGRSESVFKEPGKYVEDVAFLSPTSGLIAAIERPGKLMQSPFPGMLRILKASNLRSWIQMPVDYRANGRHAVLAVVDERNAWVALDSGMILRLEP